MAKKAVRKTHRIINRFRVEKVRKPNLITTKFMVVTNLLIVFFNLWGRLRFQLRQTEGKINPKPKKRPPSSSITIGTSAS